MHRFGFRLEDLAIDGPDPNYEGPLRSSTINTCLGSVDYSTGNDYVFELRGGTDCGTQKTFNDTHVTYTNGIRGSHGHNQAVILRRVNMLAKFACSFETTVQISTSVGQVSSKSLEIDLEETKGIFDLKMALFTDASFTDQVVGQLVVNVPDNIYIGVSVSGLNERFKVVINDCFITPDSAVDNDIKYEIIKDQCVPEEVRTL